MDDSGYWYNLDRFYSYDCSTFTKRELRPQERVKNCNGEAAIVPWTTERLQNEYETLKFIAVHTTIPVPRVIRFQRMWGSNQLVVERLHGTRLDHINKNRAQALVNAEQFLRKTVLPQLRSLTSSTSGTLTGVVIPPNRITAHDRRKHWPIQHAKTPLFNFCHNDLSQHNIIMNPGTLQVEAIIDWEFSGFYLPEFEAPLWLKAFDEPGYHDIDGGKVEKLIRFLETGNIRRVLGRL